MSCGLLLLILASITTGGSDAQLLCFGATWCQPCQEMKPTLDRLDRDGYPLHKIDVDQKADLARRYEVSSVPSFVLVDANGRVIDRIDQATSHDTLSRMLAHYEIRPKQTTVRGQNPISVPDLKLPAERPNPAGTLPIHASPPRNNSGGLQRAPKQTATPASGPNPAESPVGRAMASTIRLKVEDKDGHSFGTGTVIDVHGQEALVLTCGHIFRASDGKGRILMDRFDSPTAEPTTGSLISYDMDLDVALVSMKLSRPIKIVRLAPLTYKATKGEPIFSVGCSRGEPPTILKGNVNQIDKYLGPPNITASGRPVDGRSGGGLYNQSGELIGVCSAADPEIDEGLYAALPRVYYELDRNGLTFVYDQTQSIGEEPIAQLATTSRDLKGFAAPPKVPSAKEAMAIAAAPTVTPSETKQRGEELVCVLRGDGTSESSVFVIENPSQTLIEYLTREAAKNTQ